MEQAGAGPLSGTRVLSFTHMLQGPLASLILRGLGAEVIKIEPPSGAVERRLSGRDLWVDGRSVLDLAVNRGQRSVAVDLKHQRAAEVMEPLLASSDALVTNFRPPAMKRLGLGYEQLREPYPQLVYCSASGYGESGPYADRPGQDLLIQALTGMMGLNGRRDDPPTPLGFTGVDAHSGVLLALSACAGLVQQRQTGQGAKLEVDLFASALNLMFEPVLYGMNTDEAITRPESSLADSYHLAPYGVYATQDGQLAISTNDLPGLRRCLRKHEPGALDAYSDDGTYLEREGLAAEIAGIIATRPSGEWLEEFDAEGIWAAAVRPPGQGIVDDPQVRHRGLVEWADGAESVRTMSVPVAMPEAADTGWRPAPVVGGDTYEVMSDLGLSDDVLAGLRREGVVVWPGEASE